jgi:hypothetical protein
VTKGVARRGDRRGGEVAVAVTVVKARSPCGQAYRRQGAGAGRIAVVAVGVQARSVVVSMMIVDAAAVPAAAPRVHGLGVVVMAARVQAPK